jgi:uncharacterized membrane protein (UPF0182 family)
LSTGLLFGAVIVWLVGSVLVGSLFPSLYQNFTVKPNEITKENKYISNTISMTRQAYGLSDVQRVPLNGNSAVTQADIKNSPYIEQNARLWDYGVIKTIYDQKETLRRYYTFDDVDIDRYNLPLANNTPDETQVLISPRELNYGGLDANAQNWQNLHLQYTHGYGLQASPVNINQFGQPQNLITQNFPFSTTTSLLNVQQPRIYYGTQFDNNNNDANYALIDTSLPELDYPVTDQNSGQNAVFKYTGDGIKLDNFFVKLAFASRLGDFNLLISDALNSNSKLLFRRNVTERAQLLAPYLLYDGDPYIAVVDGKIYWIQDAYTTSNRFPHSDTLSRLGGDRNINYIRNSVKVVTDAYDGTITFYIADQAAPDPLVHTYANIYPNLFKDISQMPSGLVAHLRYPEKLLTYQSIVYLTYHTTDPTVYYSRNDQWQLPHDPRDPNLLFAPYYLVTQLPDQKQKEFSLIQPLEPQNKNNMISLLVARMDGANYGKLVAYDFPGSSNIYGPEQVYNQIQANPQFSQEATLLGQRGSQLTYGNILIFPVNNSILYVLPVYLSGSNTPIPKLQFITVAGLVATPDGGTQFKTNFADTNGTLQDTVAGLITGGSTATVPTGGNTTTGNGPSPTAGASSGTTPIAGSTPLPNNGQPSTVNDLLRSAQQHFNNAEAARQKNDLATYQQEYQAGLNDLNRVKQLLGSGS